ncbi:hypothetical protein QWI17_11155 [Gilvimarinus sp. SDUM040013]|uniref:Uncharacterized protein n=1 Tax=Gilvimarinus gilvus TaxID=3058038 RepID=A0ABU4RZK8_9GAMM|nr:hypothetical protein [Gilvimarinus sp. SDUM040013]MDO3386396.1 hypothetical protein [Gilvimarinus sp. SDUM040013]MDX6849662.1 hypothetical protein [Gilvimarinus sp. SDUM040013]
MSTPIIIALILITIAALIAVNVVNVRQKHLQLLVKQQQRYYQALEQAEDALSTCLKTVESLDVADQLNREIIVILQRLLELERFNQDPIKARLALAESRQQHISSGQLTPNLSRWCSSDTEIAALQTSLSQATRIINQRHAHQQLNDEQARQLRQQLDWAKLQISVLSIIAAGYQARDAAQITSALSYFQKAQDLLQGSRNPDPRRLEIVRQLSSVMRHERDTIELELFPESADYVSGEPSLTDAT